MTMVHVLDTLVRLGNKLDNLAIGSGSRTAPDTNSSSFGASGASSSAPAPFATSMSKAATGTSTDFENRSQLGLRDLPAELQQNYQHLTAPHKIILSPGVYMHLLDLGIIAVSDLQYILQQGTSWFINREVAKHSTPLASEVSLPCFAVDLGAAQGLSSTVAFPTLTVDRVREYSEAYFNTFNVLHPLLDRESFVNESFPRILREGYGDGDIESVLALSVFALGQVAIDGVFGRPVSVVDSQPSGLH